MPIQLSEEENKTLGFVYSIEHGHNRFFKKLVKDEMWPSCIRGESQSTDAKPTDQERTAQSQSVSRLVTSPSRDALF